MNYRKLSIRVLLLLFLITVGCLYQIRNLSFDYDFENFFPDGDPDTEFFDAHRKKFETDNDFVLIGIVSKTTVFDPAFLEEVNALTDSLGKIKNVISATSPTNFKEDLYHSNAMLPIKRSLLHYDRYGEEPEDSLRHYDSLRIYSTPGLVGNYFSKDAKALTIYIKTTQKLSKEKCDVLAKDIHHAVDQFKFDEIHIAGRSVGQSYFMGLMEKDFIMFFVSSTILIILFLIVAFRSFWGVWVPIVVVILSIIWILGVLSITGKPINMVLTVLPTIMFVVGMSDVVHILSKYFEELRNGKEKIDALKVAFKEVGFATFLTSLTTAIGFLTLLTASINPIRDFGLYTAIGVFLAYILAYSMLPAILVLIKKPKVAKGQQKDTFWSRQLSKMFRGVVRYRKLVLVGSAGVIILSVIGASNLQVNNYLLEDLKPDNPLKKDFVFFENEFSGVRPFEMGIMLKDTSKSVLDADVLVELDKIEHYLQNEYGVGFILSPVTLVKGINRSMHTGKNRFFSLPVTAAERDTVEMILQRIQHKTEYRSIISADGCTARISAKVEDRGGLEFKKQDKALHAFIKENINPELFDYKITGTAVLIDKNNSYLSSNILIGLLIAFMAVGLIVGIMFRSIRIVVLSLIPNMLPLLMIAGVMGFTGIDIKVSTSIVFTIAFGIAVDDTIHFMSKLRLELGKGRSLLYAVKRTYFSTGRAIIITSIILCSGFFTLIASDFKSTFYIGSLISLTLLFAVLADLILLPVLIMLFYKRK